MLLMQNQYKFDNRLTNIITNKMSHYNRRYLPIQSHPKPDSLDRSLPFRNNEARLKQIYEGQQIFKQKNKQPVFKKNNNKQYAPLAVKKKDGDEGQIKLKSHHMNNLNLAEIKLSNRYKQVQREQEGRKLSLYQSNENDKFRSRNIKDHVPLTTRNNKEEEVVEKNQMFKIKRKSISGSLKKKLKQQATHHLSSVNPTIPLEINYHEEGRRLYKDGRISQALKLFELAIQKNAELPQNYYYAALCFLSKHVYQRAFDFLNTLHQKFPNFNKKTIYLFLSISAKHLNKLSKAVNIVSQGIVKYPDYIDLHLYRAKLYEQQQDFQKANIDYEFVLKHRKDNAEVMLNNALCLKKLGFGSNCLALLNSALYCDQKGEFKSKILLERLKINFEQKRIKDCKKDLQKLQQLQNENCEMCYYKGLIQQIEQNKNGALLSFQKCIRLDNCKEAVAGSLIEITKSKIEDRDFYSALYHINRAAFLQVKSTEIDKFKLFTEGVVFMMKRKINEGVQNFYKLIQNYSPIGSYFQTLFYLYRAFGHFMQNKHRLAITDYEMAQKYIPKDKFIKYNQMIAEGIVAVQNELFEKALQKFDDAQNTISQGCPTQKIQPYIYRAMTFVEKIKSGNRRQPSSVDELQTLEQIFIALKELDKAYDISDGNSNMLYLRSLIYMYLGKTDDGLQDIVKAISKSQQNVAKYFFYRALAHETMNNKKQALNDFNICINLDQKHANCYLERAKLLFSNDQASKGLDDLKKLKEIQPQCDDKLHQCCLFYTIKEYDLAEACLPHIKDAEQRKRLQIHLAFKQLRISDASEKLNVVGDKMICRIILGQYDTEEVSSQQLQYFSRVEYYSYLGIKNYFEGSIEEAINNFSMAIKQKSLMDLQQNMVGHTSNQQQQESEQNCEGIIESETKRNQLHYINYNMFIAFLANHQRKKAYEVFIRDILPAKEQFLRSDQVSSLSRLLFQTMKVKESDPAVPIEAKQILQLVLFRSLISESIDFIDIQLPNFILRTKFCYLMPYAKQIYKQYLPKINTLFILQSLKISQVENRPEPPWVKRNNQDLYFTDDIIDINVEFQTTEHDEDQNQEEEYQGDEEEGQAEEEESSDREQRTEREEEEVFDPRKFRDQMRLDDDIQKKLQRIMQRKSQDRPE